MLEASVEQNGYASRMRGTGDFPPSSDRTVLNKIIHSQDQDQNTPHNIHKYGPNPFALTPEWDQKVQDALMEVAKRHKMQDIIMGLKISSFTYKIRRIVRLISTLHESTARSASIQRIATIVDEACDCIDRTV